MHCVRDWPTPALVFWQRNVLALVPDPTDARDNRGGAARECLEQATFRMPREKLGDRERALLWVQAQSRREASEDSA